MRGVNGLDGAASRPARPAAGHWVVLAAALASGLMLWGCVGLRPLWWLAWVAPVPLLWAAARGSLRRAFGLGFLAGLLGQAMNAGYVLELNGPVGLAVLWLLQSVVLGATAALWRQWVVRAPDWSWPWAFPVLSCAMGMLALQNSPHGAWGSQSITQVEALPVIQIASVFGPLGVLFLLTLGAGSLAALLLVPRQRLMAVAAAPLLMLAAGVGWGTWRLAQAPAAPTLAVGLAAVDAFLAPEMPPQRAQAVWQAYDEATRSLSRQGAQLVLLPEKIQPLRGAAAADRHAALAQAAQQAGITLAAGLAVESQPGAGLVQRANQAWVFGAQGLGAAGAGPQGSGMQKTDAQAAASFASYDKQHLVPGWEGEFRPGSSLLRVQVAGQPLGVAVCRDMDFPDLSRAYSRAGIAAMVVPAWDFDRDAWMHARMAVMRGVEGGFSVLRSARRGLMSVSDPYGRVIAEGRSAPGPGAQLLVQAPMGNGQPTPYARWGNVLGWLCLVVCGLALAASVAARWLPARRKTMQAIAT